MALGIYEALASLRLAVVVIVASATVLGWATFVESRYGTEAVQFGIYQTWWFAALTALLGVNVFAAAAIRFPWKRYQTGFVITHAGILVLLLGCLLSRWGSVDAQMPLFEGSAGHLAFEHSQHFELCIERWSPAGRAATTVSVPFAPGPFNWRDYSELFWFPWRLASRDQGIIFDRQGVRLEVLDYLSDSQLVPAAPLKLRVRTGTSRGHGEGKQGTPDPAWATVSLTVQGVDDPHAAHGRMGLGSRHQLAGGPRIVFWVASSQAETEAFVQGGPVGKLGPEGQLVFYLARRTYPFSLAAFQQRTRQALGDTGLEVELLRLDPEFLGAVLQVHGPDGPPQRMVLLADFPEFNRQDHRHGVYGAYWVDATQQAIMAKTKQADPESIHHPERPRIDILQGADGKLYYRTWHSPRMGTTGVLPPAGTKVTAFAQSSSPVTFYVEEFVPHDYPGAMLQPAPFAPKKDKAIKQRQVRLRLIVDGNAEEFWLAGLPADPLGSMPREDQRHVVFGQGRSVAVTLPWDRIDLGFQLYLHKFQRKLEPGSSQASHYSSLVELRDRDGNRLETGGDGRNNQILITLNQPVNFSDPSSGRSYRIYQEAYRGPWKPGDPEFDQLTDGGGSRDELFLSWLTVNYDPGRGLKYAGCLMIVAGIATVFYMKAYFFRRRPPLRKA